MIKPYNEVFLKRIQSIIDNPYRYPYFFEMRRNQPPMSPRLFDVHWLIREALDVKFKDV